MTPTKKFKSLKSKSFHLSNDLGSAEHLNSFECSRLSPSLPQFHAADEGILRSTQNKSRRGAVRGHSVGFGLQPGLLKRPHQDSPFSRDSEMIPGGSPSSTHDPLPVPRVK